MIVILVISAFIADLIGLIPFAKDFTASIFWVVVSAYFWIKGMGIFNGRKLAAMAISWIASIIPFIQEIPLEIVAGIVAIIIITRIEDKTGISVTKPLTKGVTQPRLKRIPLNNKPGIRPPRKTSNFDNKNNFPLN